jgi:hypothetical protein
VFEGLGRQLGFDTLDVLPPNAGAPRVSRIDDAVETAYLAALEEITADEWRNVRPVLYFHDSSNAHWKRSGSGILLRASGTDAVPEGVLRQVAAAREQRFRERMTRADDETDSASPSA